MPSKKTKETAVAEEIKEAVVQQDTAPESKTARKKSSSRKTTSKRAPKTKAVAETVKTEEIKTDAEVKVEEPAAEVVTAEAPAVQEIAAEEPVKKEAAQKKRVRNLKKASEPKKRVRKPAAAPAPVVNKNSLTLQINGRNYTEERFLREAKDVWVYDMGMKADEFINVELVVKPDEAVVTGMVNGKTEIRFSI